jgi:lipopolysaccharide transport system permease protein
VVRPSIEVTLIEVAARRPGLFGRAQNRLRELWASRELLFNLVSAELKVRYRRSVFGFAWTMLTPIGMMLIFTFIFTRVFRAGIENFPVFFLAGFLPWQYFSNSIMGGTGIIVGNANLIKKVYFPREVLPLAHVLAQSVHFLLSLVVLFGYLIYRGDNFYKHLPLLLLATVLLTIFSAGLTMVFAAANVVFRDLQELVQVLFLLWFYATPVIYPLEMVTGSYQTLLRLNPMTSYLSLFRHAMYYFTWPSPRLLAGTTVVALVTFIAGYAAFTRLAVSFAKEV